MLKINYQTTSIIVDRLPLVLHWSIDYVQASYQVSIYKDLLLVHKVTGIDDSTSVLLENFAIEQNSTYRVEVTSYGESGELFSQSNLFSTSNFGEFKGKWIYGAQSFADPDRAGIDTRNTVLRKKFSLHHDFNHAVINIVGLGFYTLYVNGHKVSASELNTDWSNYAKTVYYDTYDLTDYLIVGNNQIVVELANGWFNPAAVKLFGKYNLRETLNTGVTQAMADVMITGESEATQLVTDHTWEYCEGAYITNNIYLGETVDFRLFSGRNTTDLVDPQWQPVSITDGPQGQRCASYIPKIEKIKSVDFDHIHVVDENEFIIDFGETISGLLDLSVTASEGQIITLLYGENIQDGYQLNTDSTLAGFIGKEVAPGVVINGGENSPLRGEQLDRIICRSGTNHYVNKYTWHSFRYVKVNGMNLDQLNHVLAHYAHSKLESSGEFLCSDVFLNRLYETARTTKLNNIHSVFSDCARERFAYGGDIVALAKSQVYQFDSAKMYEKTIQDFINDIRPNGGFPETAPFVGIKTNGTGESAGPLGWQLVVPFLLNIHYQHYGTLDLARVLLPYLERQLEHLNNIGYEQLVKCCLGDWGSRDIGTQDYKSGSPALNFTTACIYYLHYKLMHKFCTILNLQKKTRFYSRRALEIRNRIIADFKNPDGSFADKSQTSYIFALYNDLSDNSQHLIKELVSIIKTNNYTITCGIFGQSFLYEVLRKYSENEVVMKWLHSEAGFKSMLQDGATTLHEFFGANNNGSCNHAMFSSYTSWMMQGPGGIVVEEDARGSDTVKIQPVFLDSLNFVDCWHKTIYGNIYCKWQRLTKGIEIVIKVPFNLKKCSLLIPEGYNVSGQSIYPFHSDGVNQYFDIKNKGDVNIFLTRITH